MYTQNENLDEWRSEDWTVEGFMEAGNILEDILTEVIAFAELKDMLEKGEGTVQTNKHEHQTSSTSGKSQLGLEEEQPCQEKEIRELQETVAGTVPPEPSRKLLRETIPPDRAKEIEKIRKEIGRIIYPPE